MPKTKETSDGEALASLMAAKVQVLTREQHKLLKEAHALLGQMRPSDFATQEGKDATLTAYLKVSRILDAEGIRVRN